MINIEQNKSLQQLHTFHTPVKVNYYCTPVTIDEIKEALQFASAHNLPILVLGEGSNLLFLRDFKGLVIHLQLTGYNVIKENEKHVYIKSNGGNNWDAFVEYTVGKGWQGLENLSLIPGNVGASPIQNIGAYGVEVKDFITEVEALDMTTLKPVVFSNEDCNFAYRNSVFKNALKGKVVIYAVTFRLNKIPDYQLSYGNLSEQVAQIGTPTALNIRKAVIQIRESKLPNPDELGNAGSFFKNPVISKTAYKFLQGNFPSIPSYPVNDGIKVPAAWLIEKAGWKGKSDGKVATYYKHPLILVNQHNALGVDVYNFSERIIRDIRYAFNIKLEREVNIIG